MATACFSDLPERLSSAIFAEITSCEVPFKRGICKIKGPALEQALDVGLTLIVDSKYFYLQFRNLNRKGLRPRPYDT
jgi:hypothetical protein